MSTNKNVEGLWIVTGILNIRDANGNIIGEAKAKRRVATTKAGLKNAISSARKYTSSVIRVEVEEYTIGEMRKYNE